MDENAGGWRLECVADDEDLEVRHCWPIDDSLEHRLGTDCPCRPHVDRCGKRLVLVAHHAFDAREWFERRYGANTQTQH